MTQSNRQGRVEVAPHAIATIAGEAVLRCYGVVGVANKSLIDGLAELLQPDRWVRGVEVQVRDAQVVVDLYVIVQYGTRISEVAHGVMNSVRYALEQALGMPIGAVNVHVQGLRVPNDSQQ
jgi:uncharacterized alkaline shock family protein YloU